MVSWHVFQVLIAGNLKAGNLKAGNLIAANLKAANLKAGNLKAGNLIAGNENVTGLYCNQTPSICLERRHVEEPLGGIVH